MLELKRVERMCCPFLPAFATLPQVLVRERTVYCCSLCFQTPVLAGRSTLMDVAECPPICGFMRCHAYYAIVNKLTIDLEA